MAKLSKDGDDDDNWSRGMEEDDDDDDMLLEARSLASDTMEVIVMRGERRGASLVQMTRQAGEKVAEQRNPQKTMFGHTSETRLGYESVLWGDGDGVKGWGGAWWKKTVDRDPGM